MGKASSSKKIKRVQQAGVSRAPGQRRNLGYPALIVAIFVVGSVLVFFARTDRQASAGDAPVANRDHWHAAFGIDICGEFQENVGDVGPDTLGIHTHQDGLIHIHPFGAGGAGENATFGKFAEQVGIQLGDGEFTLADGTTYTNGDDCETDDGTEPGQVALYQWPPQATEATEPEVITENIADVRFEDDGEAYVLAFVPDGAEVTLPPSLPELASPNDLVDPSQEGSTDFVDPALTTSTIAEGADPDGSEPADTAPPTTAPATDGTDSGN